MAFTSQPYFIAKLDGVDVNELNKKLDYKKTSLEERKQLIENVLDETDFYTEYFSEHFKGDINSGDHTSSGINVCQSLEKMADYLLNSDEVKKMEDEEETKYVFHTDQNYFQKKLDRENMTSNLLDDNDDDKTIHFLLKATKNYKSEVKRSTSLQDISINENRSRDYDDIVLDYLKQNKEFLNYIDDQLRNPTMEGKRFKFTTAKEQVVQDIYYAKDFVMGIFGHKPQNLYESTEPNTDVFDFTNHDHLKGKIITYVNHLGRERNLRVGGLLQMVPNTFDLRDDFVHILWDLQQTIDKANLTKLELDVLELTRSGYEQQEIADKLNRSQSNVSKIFDRIAKKVASVGNKYDMRGMG